MTRMVVTMRMTTRGINRTGVARLGLKRKAKKQSIRRQLQNLVQDGVGTTVLDSRRERHLEERRLRVLVQCGGHFQSASFVTELKGVLQLEI